MNTAKPDSTTPRSQWAGPAKPSMNRRCDSIDYRSRMMYMVTLVTEGRRPLFGEVAGRSDAPEGSPDAPHISLSPLGERVRDNFLSIAKRHSEIEVLALQMMPDHLHGILFVTARMEKHLGQVISGFKSGCNDRLLLREGQLERWLNYLADNPRRLLVKREHRDLLAPRFGIAVGGYTFSAIGNLALLRAPGRLLRGLPFNGSPQ